MNNPEISTSPKRRRFLSQLGTLAAAGIAVPSWARGALPESPPVALAYVNPYLEYSAEGTVDASSFFEASPEEAWQISPAHMLAGKVRLVMLSPGYNDPDVFQRFIGFHCRWRRPAWSRRHVNETEARFLQEAGGFTAISPGSSAATPRVSCPRRPLPEGVPAGWQRPRRLRSLRDRFRSATVPGVSAAARPRPPANGCHVSGMLFRPASVRLFGCSVGRVMTLGFIHTRSRRWR